MTMNWIGFAVTALPALLVAALCWWLSGSAWLTLAVFVAAWAVGWAGLAVVAFGSWSDQGSH